MIKKPGLTTAFGAPVPDNQNIMTAGPRGPALLQDVWFLEKMAHFDREVIPERRMHAKGAAAYCVFTVTHYITLYTRANLFSEVGKQTDLFLRFSTVALKLVIIAVTTSISRSKSSGTPTTEIENKRLARAAPTTLPMTSIASPSKVV